MKLFDWLLDLLYPPRCVFCRKLLRSDETEVCTKCRGKLPQIEGTFKRGQFFSQCCSVYEYRDEVADSLKRYKFGGLRHYAAAYGRLLAMCILRERLEFDVLTWAPISKKRRLTRGYDQSRLLAEAVARELGVQCVQTLEKIRDNPAQSTMKDAAARHANVMGVYRAVAPERFADKRVLLIDDIITTGSTLSECSFVLRKAGAADVQCATVAATQLSQ